MTFVNRTLVAALLVLACFASACQTFGRVGASEDRGLSRVLDTGELRVGMSGDQLPMNHRTQGGEWLGFEVAVMNVLAKNLGVRAEFVQRPFHELLDALDAGEVDVVMSGLTITPMRNRRAAFIGPYFVTGKSLLAQASTLATLRTLEDVDRDGVRLVALLGSTSETFARRMAPTAELTVVETLGEGVELLLGQRVDALVADYQTCALARLRYPDANLEYHERPFTIEPMGIAVPPGDTLLANLLENYLGALMLNGGLERIRSFWLEDRTWLGKVAGTTDAAAPAGTHASRAPRGGE